MRHPVPTVAVLLLAAGCSTASTPAAPASQSLAAQLQAFDASNGHYNPDVPVYQAELDRVSAECNTDPAHIAALGKAMYRDAVAKGDLVSSVLTKLSGLDYTLSQAIGKIDCSPWLDSLTP